MSGVVKIKPAIQHYAWGGKTFIPSFLHVDATGKPFAEAWYGDHPLGSATIVSTLHSISELIASNPSKYLGSESVHTYGNQLPFLLKVLDVHDMLSIQLHPDKESARAGFEDENNRGIPLNAPHRNYKDANHKPELLFALSDFWMLQGFAPVDEIRNRFTLLLPDWDLPSDASWQSIFNEILDKRYDDVKIYSSILSNLSKTNISDKNQIYHWVDKAIKTYPMKDNTLDIGFLVMLLLQVQYLRPGQVGFQAAGVLHAYLEGQNIELMSNSDNVLRGGLTPKHIDVTELKKHVDFSQSGQYLIPALYLMEDESSFTPPVKDFSLNHYTPDVDVIKEIQMETASILLITQGEISIHDQIIKSGESVFIPAYEAVNVKSLREGVEYFLAFGNC